MNNESRFECHPRPPVPIGTIDQDPRQNPSGTLGPGVPTPKESSYFRNYTSLINVLNPLEDVRPHLVYRRLTDSPYRHLCLSLL